MGTFGLVVPLYHNYLYVQTEKKSGLGFTG